MHASVGAHLGRARPRMPLHARWPLRPPPSMPALPCCSFPKPGRGQRPFPALRTHAPALHHAGCSTAGEITPQGLEDGHVLAMLLPSASSPRTARWSTICPPRHGQITVRSSAEALVAWAHRPSRPGTHSRFASSMVSPMPRRREFGHPLGSRRHTLLGGSAGDDLKFETTRLISNGRVTSDSAIIVLIATEIPSMSSRPTISFPPTKSWW